MTKKIQNPQVHTSFPLNPEQKAAAEAPFSPLLIVAGAGTGKTRTLTSRIAYLIERGVPPKKICAITFTNKAAKEMAERTQLMLGTKQGPFIGTFHSLGARILREECRMLDRKPNFTIFDDHDSFSLIKKAVKSVLPKKEQGASAEERKKTKETPMMFSGEISKIKNVSYSEPSSELGKEKYEAVQEVFQKYESALIENNAFDFDDLIGKAVAVMKANPAILKKYQDRYDAVLVDEYQDINPKQYELVQLLADRHRNVSVVGDDEQTIYSWRYADIRLFLDFEKSWPGAKIFFLEENYRSTGNIINAASAVVKNNLFRTPKTLWTKNPAGERIKFFEAWGENEEAEWIAQEIEKSKESGTAASAPQTAILYRTNAQSRAIEQALIRRNIPYQIFGGLKFYERREVKDAVAALRYVSNPSDTVSRERLEKNLSKKKFAAFKEALVKASAMAPHEIIALFLEKFNYFEYLEDGFINYDEREGNIAELITFASGFESLSELLERLSLLQAIDDENNKDGERKKMSPATVSLMTIHLAKGLEFDSVFLMGASEGLLPHGRSLADNRQLEEERRLMYVAMTRARKNLAISFYGTPSRFIEEIPAEYITLSNGSDDAMEILSDNDDDYEERWVAADE